MPQVIRTPLADQAAELLLERIRAGEWELGAKLPGETTLAPQLGVGRSTVREAIRQLAGRGILTTRQGSGVFVTALDTHDDWETVLRRADITTVLEARIAIESEAARLAPNGAHPPTSAPSAAPSPTAPPSAETSKATWTPTPASTAPSLSRPATPSSWSFSTASPRGYVRP